MYLATQLFVPLIYEILGILLPLVFVGNRRILFFEKELLISVIIILI